MLLLRHETLRLPSSTTWLQEHTQQGCWLAAKSLGNLTEFDHVQAALTSLHLRHEALWLPQPLRELDLSDFGRLPHGSDEGDELLMPLRENR